MRAFPPLVLAALALIVGIAMGLRFTPPAPPVLLLAAAIAAVALLVMRRHAAAGALCAITVLGAALGSDGAARWEMDCRAQIEDGAAVELEGRLTASWSPHIWQVDRFAAERHPMLPLALSDLRVEGDAVRGCGGNVRIRLPEDTPPLPAGTALRVVGLWATSPGPVLQPAWPQDPVRAGFLRADSISQIAGSGGVGATILSLRGRTEVRIHELFPGHASLIDGLVLGRREAMDPGLRDRFARAGMAHFLAISGMHVGLIAGGILLVVRFFGMPWRRTAVVSIVLIAGYLILIGAPVSALRAGLMISLAVTGLSLQRPFSPLSVVAAAAIGILLLRPAAIVEPGFQLSFAGTIGILLLRETLLRRVPHAWQEGGPRWVVEGIAASVAAFLATAPIAAYHFGIVAPVSVLVNLPGTALLALALAAAGMALPLSLVVPPVAEIVAGAGGVVLEGLDLMARAAGALPWSHLYLTAGQVVALVVAAVAGGIAFAFARGMRPPVRALTVVVAMIAVLVAAPTPQRAGALEIYYLDVGQGDATAIRTPAGRWLMIDTGPVRDMYDAGERRVVPFLRRMGVTRLEAIILTHPHLDHYGGTEAVMRHVEVGRIIDPGMPVGTERYLRLLEAAEVRGVPWALARAGRTLRIDGVEIDLLWPEEEALGEDVDPNEISVVAHLRYGGFAALFTGDAYAPQERELVRRHGAGLRSDVLKAGHHGSRTSTDPWFLDTVRPRLVVISAGRRNLYGHPHAAVLDRLRERGITVARTDRHGTIRVRVDELGRSWEWIGAEP